MVRKTTDYTLGFNESLDINKANYESIKRRIDGYFITISTRI